MIPLVYYILLKILCRIKFVHFQAETRNLEVHFELESENDMNKMWMQEKYLFQTIFKSSIIGIYEREEEKDISELLNSEWVLSNILRAVST